MWVGLSAALAQAYVAAANWNALAGGRDFSKIPPSAVKDYKMKTAGRWRSLLLILLSGIFLSLHQITCRADSQTVNNGWHFSIAPYGWIIQVNGDITVKGDTEDLFVTFKEILQNLDIGAEGHIEGGLGE